MTSLKALLPLAVLLLLSVAPTETKVVESMTECNQFFLRGNPPNIPRILQGGNIWGQNRYKTICQTFENIPTFVTLYDTNNKIPVFSAAKYRGDHEGTRPKPSPWMIEPQLDDTKGNNNMAPDNNKKTYENQAGNTDYKNKQGYDRGHLFPSSYGYDQIEKTSTFTLTNIVPQNKYFNNGSWYNMEKCIKCVMDEYCINENNKVEGYVVIGAQPSNKPKLNNRVNIPSMLWSAFCCYNSKDKKWLASAHWGENIKPKNKYLKTKTLQDLHKKLGKNTEVFPKTECPLKATVTNVYKNLNSNCNCQP
ncbi:endonuclease domain-containing 1 protein-like isoform X2 [Mugil cephalus]|uniref:endonuclease domain-containing 1 protein-like isoform X2 n=1 Tax=Mugil cephalus TaxID=48193 RepID=UPI001FB5B338|nr:endonuclease domain-containing 1 protein-like isoform X2 [Mugil cephalus]XP_047452204.1 endonuclease domain-containing 1 protein-like isoform X2 [Mugil cephalus]